MRIHLKLSLAAAALALSVAAFAQEDPMAKGQGQPSMSHAATPAPETGAKSAAQAKFDALDANHDGYIDKQEAAVSKPLADEFARIDSNKDNKLSLIEFQSVKDLASIKTGKDGYH